MTNISLSLEQEGAVDMCCDLTTPIVSVSGGAGVGKTLVLGKVYEELRRRKKQIVLAAPTGRAAKRIEELTRIKAKTVHRMLEFPLPDEDVDPLLDPNEPRRTKDNPLEEDVIIIDEASMISPGLYRFILNAMKRGSVVRWFGDNNQLPPIEEGKPPFISLLQTHPACWLTYNFRSGDMLIDNAQRILRGLLPRRNPRFEIIYSEYPLDCLLDFVTSEFTTEDYQIITPTRKGRTGSIRSNPSIQMKFNSRGTMLRLDRFDKQEAPLAIREKDKFIWIKNDYKLDLYNGELGYIDWVDADAGELGVVTGERAVVIPSRVKTYNAFIGHIINYDPRKQIELGYAITTHKAQGSEFKTIIYYMSRSQAWLLNRRNFYTGITRARENVILITDRRSMNLSMRRYEDTLRR
jgi:exodeoxyribonuclease V alpha subunit